MLDKDKIMEEAMIRCYREMYRKAQPRGDFDKYRRMIKNGELPKDTRIYERHYLPQKEFEYILNKYVKAYRFENQWKSDVDLILQHMKNGGFRDAYYKDKSIIEHTAPLYEQIGKENADKVIQFVEELKDFFRFDRDESEFRSSIALGCSPTSNPETVKEYWKSQGIDVEINEKKNLTEDDYWELDYYGHLVSD